jgi:hypothetical protein
MKERKEVFRGKQTIRNRKGTCTKKEIRNRENVAEY